MQQVPFHGDLADAGDFNTLPPGSSDVAAQRASVQARLEALQDEQKRAEIEAAQLTFQQSKIALEESERLAASARNMLAASDATLAKQERPAPIRPLRAGPGHHDVASPHASPLAAPSRSAANPGVTFEHVYAQPPSGMANAPPAMYHGSPYGGYSW